MNHDGRYYLQQLKQRYRALRLIDCVLPALAGGLITYSVAAMLVSPWLTWLTSCSAAIGIMLWRMRTLGLFQLTLEQIVTFIHRERPDLLYSTDLLLKGDGALTSLQRLQKYKAHEALAAIHRQIRFPHTLRQSSLLVVLAVLLFVVKLYITPHLSPAQTQNETAPATMASLPAMLPAAVDQMRLHISPPPYTQLTPYDAESPAVRVVEGSTLRWEWTFTKPVSMAALIFNSKDTSRLKSVNSTYTLQRSVQAPGFYQLIWQADTSSVQASPYYKLDVTPDLSPQVSVDNLNQFTEVSFKTTRQIQVHTTLRDDYGLSDAYIIATVAKGSGESVKFREEKLSFQEMPISGRSKKATRTLNLVKLGLEPGDELYFYAEAWDIKSPHRQRSRTETFFVSIPDTTQQEVAEDAGLGVDLMPTYFRSQRQIIIDTEKLIRDKKTISSEAFKNRSNELGYDQKVLRLKYGEFLGEEFESGIAVEHVDEAPGDHDDHEEEEDVTKKFGHVHDTENEHNLVADKQPDHHQHHEGDDKKESPLAAFAHQHDDAEEATFFFQSTRVKLKAALTIMWDAELHLRLYTPEKSLPYQYKALKLLKEISNDSRIYVHKTGFDPPPVKEDKRLSGDLSAVHGSSGQRQVATSESWPAIRKALRVTEALLQQPQPVLSSTARTTIKQSGVELAALALETPGQYLDALSAIQAIGENKIDRQQLTDLLYKLRQTYWRVLPTPTARPGVAPQPLHPLDQQFLQQLKP